MHETLATTMVSRRESSALAADKPEPLDLLVDGRVLLDVSVRARDVGLRLVIIEVADEILHRVVREKLLELGIKLRGERFVVGNDQRRPVQFANDVGDGERFAGARDAEQRLMPVAGLDRFEQLGNRLALVAAWLVIRFELKRHAGI